MNYEKCLCCGGTEFETGYVNTQININGPEERSFGVISQKVYKPTDAFICKNCGYVALFLDWDRRKDY